MLTKNILRDLNEILTCFTGNNSSLNLNIFPTSGKFFAITNYLHNCIFIINGCIFYGLYNMFFYVMVLMRAVANLKYVINVKEWER